MKEKRSIFEEFLQGGSTIADKCKRTFKKLQDAERDK